MAKRGKPRRRIPLADRFWRKVDKTGDCWLWAGSTNIHGRGQVNIDKHMISAHRVAYELTYGPIPDGLWVLHHCDVPLCVRPDHLFLGTHHDNMRDMAIKQRSTHGSRSNFAKLDEATVIAIREMSSHVTPASIAGRFGVSASTVSRILAGVTWRYT